MKPPPNSSRLPRQYCSAGRGFTLVEVLVAVSISLILIGLGSMAFSGLVHSWRMRQTVEGITKILEIARETAITQQTYVWVGIREASPVLIGASASLNGEPTTTANNLYPLVRCLNLDDDDLAAITIIPSPAVEANETAVIDLAIDSTRVKSSCSLTFTPQGQVVMAGSVSAITPTVGRVLIRLEFPRGDVVEIGVQGNNGTLTQHW